MQYRLLDKIRVVKTNKRALERFIRDNPHDNWYKHELEQIKKNLAKLLEQYEKHGNVVCCACMGCE